ncbi:MULTISPECIES: ABC transporter substrate-binding protein [unclassified Bradyrhizobium]|uniref:ABC transporter substrate-binding protein n=1 Tax=unclassified Bradyrhizobium TaxID=2631580 RepID=UPI00230675E2|nr:MULTISPECIES: ABC transporter substrate-binding protein [unclassified Bradyrhizobium]MDA9451219.1 ABC transporter permease [Bradyrhizobium sp. CCBAU 21360]MDA9457598.1 ABC transporter permease [Bradyrhizobium sp. CCBAU 21359]
MRFGVGVTLFVSAFAVHSTLANAGDRIAKIGVLSDQSSLYADSTGPGSTAAAQMAVDDSGLSAKGWKIEVISGDHQNKPDVGAAIARKWLDTEAVDAIADVPNSGVALAVNTVVREKNAVFLNSGAATSDLTGEQCSPNTVHWTYDTYMLSHGTGAALAKQGGNTWFFVTADYAFGKAMERDTSEVVQAAGGRILGGVKHPLNTSDFSSFLLQAQSSRAKVIALANAGGDTSNAIKQAKEFGIVEGGQKLAALLLFITDVHAMGLDAAQGLSFTTSFYWDRDDGTRDFSKRFQERVKSGFKPTLIQAGVYASVAHYLKVLDAQGGNPHDGKAIVAKMKEMPTEDALFGKGTIREDGRKLHPAYLYEVKKPSESKAPWDYYKLVSIIPPEEAWAPLSGSKCALVRK